MSEAREHWYRRVRDILGFIGKMENILKGRKQEDVQEDEVLYLALERLLQNIGEASIHIPDDIKQMAPQIPWKNIAGMRHVLVHGYDVVDDMIVWDAATREVYILKEFLVTLKGDEL